jgi:predicted acylesterase/phospholipase RssA
MPEPQANPGNTRRVLVIEGGGAKGAYAFGALLAFREFGLQFDATAGTSAGALNGLLWSTRSLDRGSTIWENLTFSSIYPVRILRAKSYPAWVIRAVASVYVLLHLLVATIEGVPNVLDFPLRISIGLTVAALWMVPFLVAGKAPLLVLGSGFVFAFWFAWAMSTDEGRRRWRAMMRLYVRLGPTALVILLLLHAKFGDGIMYLTAKILVLGVALFFTIAFTNMAIKAIKSAAERATVLGRDGLVKEIHAILSDDTISRPTWATTASFVELYDPDRASTFTDGRSGTIEAFHTLRGTWIPHYSDLSKLPKQQAIELCLASAALPFGIVLPVVVGDVKHVDGGVVDNPIFPFMDNSDIDEVFVVSLRRSDNANGELDKGGRLWHSSSRISDAPISAITARLP